MSETFESDEDGKDAKKSSGEGKDAKEESDDANAEGFDLERYLNCAMWCAVSGLYRADSVYVVALLQQEGDTKTDGSEKSRTVAYGLVPDADDETFEVISAAVGTTEFESLGSRDTQQVLALLRESALSELFVSLPYADRMRFPDAEGLVLENRSGQHRDLFAGLGLRGCAHDPIACFADDCGKTSAEAKLKICARCRAVFYCRSAPFLLSFFSLRALSLSCTHFPSGPHRNLLVAVPSAKPAHGRSTSRIV